MEYTEYYRDREQDKALGYRLRRRTKEVIAALKPLVSKPVGLVLDVGCADRLMLNQVVAELGTDEGLGLDYNIDLMRMQKDGAAVCQADALRLPITDACADVVLATAMIEHVADPEQAAAEFYRVLRKGGVCVLTTPNPTMEAIATKVGLLKDDTHYRLFDLKSLGTLVVEAGFQLVGTKRFMLSPRGMPCEELAEKILKVAHLDFILANQLVVGQKVD